MIPSNTVTDVEWNEFRELLKLILSKNIVTVTFTKVDGSIRVMRCTTDSKYIPIVENKSEGKPRKENPNVLAVYDVEANGWRSFVIKSVKEVKTDLFPG